MQWREATGVGQRRIGTIAQQQLSGACVADQGAKVQGAAAKCVPVLVWPHSGVQQVPGGICRRRLPAMEHAVVQWAARREGGCPRQERGQVLRGEMSGIGGRQVGGRQAAAVAVVRAAASDDRQLVQDIL